MSSLKEIMNEDSVQKSMENTKAKEEIRVLDEFFDQFQKDMLSSQSKAIYGIDHVWRAAEMGAIQQLLITDELFRSSSPKERLKYIDLTDIVEKNKGKVYIFSTLHTTGQDLKQHTGVAAILRYPMDMDNESSSESSDEDYYD
jgi:protein pelota